MRAISASTPRTRCAPRIISLYAALRELKHAPKVVSRSCRSIRSKHIGRRSRHRNNPGVGPRPIEPRAVGGVEAHRQPVTALFRLIGENPAARAEPGHRIALVAPPDGMHALGTRAGLGGQNTTRP